MNCSRLQLTASENQEIDFTEIILSGSCFLAISAACLISFTVDFEDSGISNFSNSCSSYMKLFVTFNNDFFVSQVSKLMHWVSHLYDKTFESASINLWPSLSKQLCNPASCPGLEERVLDSDAEIIYVEIKKQNSQELLGKIRHGLWMTNYDASSPL